MGNIEKNNKNWEKMKGKFKPGDAILRFRGDMKADNAVMRDPVLFRIIDEKHYTLGKNKKTILKAFGNSKVTRNELNKAVGVIRSLGIEENVRKQALKYAEKAEKSLSKYSGSAKIELIALLDFVVKRNV